MADEQTIDRLAVEITTNIKGEKKMTNFANALRDLSRTTQSINTSRLTSIAKEMRSFTQITSSMNVGNIKNLTNSLARLSNINPNLSGISGMTSAINSLSAVSAHANDLKNLANALSRLANADMSKFNTSGFGQITSSISALAGQLSGIQGIDSNITRLVSAIAKLSSSGQYISNVSKELPILGTSLTKLVVDLSKVGTIDANISKLVDGIAKLANAGKKAADTTANLDSFGDAVVRLVNKLKGLGQINANLATTIQGLGNLATGTNKLGVASASVQSSGTGMGKVFGFLGKSLLNVVNPFTSFTEKLGISKKKSRDLASTIGLLYAKFWLLKRAIQGVGSFVSSAQDYIEEFNYFSVALDKIAQDTKEQFKEAGYKSADEYANSFKTRFSKLQTQMTGYKIEDNGDLEFLGQKNLGLDISSVMRYQGAIAQITNSTGQMGEVSINAAKALSMLSADWSSLANQDLADVQHNFQSALVGQTRAVYRYGIDLTNANLQQIAFAHGITMSTAKMSNMSKQQLRIIGMLEQSKVAYTDLSRTINQPANQLRMLQAGFTNLARTIGSIFLPVVQKIYPYLNAVVMVLQEFFGWIAKLTGVKLGDNVSSYAMPETPDMEEPADDSGKLADNTKKAAKNTKKIKDNIQGFDILNKLEKNDDTDNGGKNKGGTGLGGANIDLSKDIKDLLDNYEKLWNKAFKDNTNKAVKLAKKIKNALLKAWKKGDFSKIGSALAKWINDGLKNIPWEKIKNGLAKIAKSAATFLNGFIDDLDWKLVGETIANGLNTAINTAYVFWTTFDWLKFGTQLAKGVMGFVKKFDAAKFGALLGAKLRGFIQLAFGFVTNIDFKAIGTKISSAINNFFAFMGKIDPRTKLTGWQELGKTIGDSIKGALDTVLTILDKTNWDEIGKAIGDFLGGIDWFGILAKVGKVIAKALFTALKVAIKAFMTDPVGVSGALITVLGGIFAFKKLTGFFDTFRTMFAGGLQGSLLRAIKGIDTGGIGSSVTGNGGFLSNILGKLLPGSLRNVIPGFKSMGQAFAKACSQGFGGHIGSGLAAAFKTGSSVSVGAGGVGIAFAAAAAAGVAIGKIWCNAIDEQIEAHEFASKMGKKIGEMNTKEITKKIKKSLSVIKTDYTPTTMSTDKLQSAYKRLAEKTNRSAVETKTMKAYAKELAKRYPELSDAIDKKTGKQKKDTSALNEAIEAGKRHENIINAQKEAVKLYNKQKPLADSYKDAKGALDEAQKKLDEFKNKHEEVVKKYNNAKLEFNWTTMDWENPYQDEYNKSMSEMGKYAEKVNEARAAVNKLKKAQRDNNRKLEQANNLLNLGKISNTKYKESVDALRKKMSSLGVKTKAQNEMIRSLKDAVDKGYLSWDEYKNIVDKNYKSQNDFKKAVGDALTKTSEYRDLTADLKDKMSSLNIPAEKQSKYIEAIKKSMSNGTTSLSNYRDIVEKSASSTEKLESAMNKIDKKNVKASVDVKTKGGEKAKKGIDNIVNGKYSTIKLALGIDDKSKKDTENKVKDEIKKLSKEKIKILVEYQLKQNEAKHGGMAELQEHFSDVYNLWSKLGKSIKETIKYNDKTKNIEIPKKYKEEKKRPKSVKTLIKQIELAGINIKWYKKGGFLEDGLFTMNKGEIAGKFDNGKSVVANNQQITEGFARSITQTLAPAIYSAVKQAMNETDMSGNTAIYLDGTEITKNVQMHNRQMTRTRGVNPMLV